MKKEPLKFAVFLHALVQKKRLTWAQAAKLCGIRADRMEKLASGQNEPLAADAIRLERGLGIHWDPEDFEERGLSL